MSNKFEDIDDDLAGIETKIAAKPTTTVAAATTVTADEDDGVDLIEDRESLKAQAGLSSVLPKEAGKVNRFALVKGYKAYQKATHYLSTVGKGMTVVCPGAGCPECAKAGDHGSRRKIAALAVKYEVDNNGKFPQGTVKPVLSIGFINMSPTAYSEITECPSENEDIYSIDFKSSKKSNGIGWNFNRQSNPTAYTKFGMEVDVAELAAPYADGKILKSRLGKTVSVTELKALLAGGTLVDTSATATLSDIEGF